MRSMVFWQCCSDGISSHKRRDELVFVSNPYSCHHRRHRHHYLPLEDCQQQGPELQQRQSFLYFRLVKLHDFGRHLLAPLASRLNNNKPQNGCCVPTSDHRPAHRLRSPVGLIIRERSFFGLTGDFCF